MEGQHISHKNRKPSGPIFDKKPLPWKKIYISGGVGVAIIIIVILRLTGAFKNSEIVQQESKSESALISVVVIRNDGPVKLARRGLGQYLMTHPMDISSGQKIYIEERLRRNIGSTLRVGDTVVFSITDIESVITKANALTSLQLEAWKQYAQGVKF